MCSKICDAWDEYNQSCMLSRMENLGCVFCDSLIQLMQHKGKHICRKCLKEITGAE